MPLLKKLSLPTSFGALTVAGGSRAGESTVVLLPQFRLALDAGRAHRALPPMSTLVLSHGHADHIGGLVYWASQRFLGNLGHSTLLAPAENQKLISELLEIHATLEGGRPYDVSVEAISDGFCHLLRKDIDLFFFPTDHWVPTLGTEIVMKKKQLLPSLVGLSGEKIAARRRRGEEINQFSTLSLLSYCADSGPELFATRPQIFMSEVLILECSFFDPADRQRAKQFGHMHLDDLLEIAPEFRCRHLVVQHASRRHSLREVEAILRDRLEPQLNCKLHSLNLDWD